MDRKIKLEIIGSCTLLTHANDIKQLGEPRYDVEESTRKLIKSSYNMGLVVNETQTISTW